MKDKSKLLKILCLVISAIILIFLAIYIYFYRNEPPLIDSAIRDFFYNIRGEKYGFMFWFNRLITEFGNFFIVVLVLLVLVITTRLDYRAILAIIGVMLALILNLGLKEFYDRVRPIEENRWMVENTTSFPSAHSTIAGFLYSYIIYMIWHTDLKKYVKNILYGVNVLIIFLVMSSRLVLGVHYFTDVIAGLISGIMVSALMMYLSKYMVENDILQKGIFKKKRNEWSYG